MTASLTQLIARGESATLELKRSTGEWREAMQTLCAFANGKGGQVIFGVKPSGELVGQQVSDQTLQEIAAARDRFEPPIELEVEKIEVAPGLSALVLSVSGMKDSVPFTFDGRAFERVENTTRKMAQERYESLLLERAHSRRRWENQVAEEVTLKDIDRDEVFRIVQIIRSNGRLTGASGRGLPGRARSPGLAEERQAPAGRRRALRQGLSARLSPVRAADGPVSRHRQDRVHGPAPASRTDVFHRAGFIEKWGRGTNRVAEMCRAASIAPPEFEEVTGAAVVTFKVAVAQTRTGDRGGLPGDRGGLPGDRGGLPGDRGGLPGDRGGLVGGVQPEQIDAQIRQIVGNLGARPRKAVLREAILALATLRAWRPAELAKVLRFSTAKLTERHLKEMVEQGLLERVHPENPAHPAQAYRAAGSRRSS